MAGPLRPVPGYDPGAGGWGNNHALLSALLNVATLGEHQHPGSVRAYGSDLAHSLDPRTPAGAANLATILVPGARRGGPTLPQQEFLDAIYGSSRGVPEWNAQKTGVARRPMFEMQDPFVETLARATGAPASVPSANTGVRIAANPWAGLTRGGTMFNPRARLGISQKGDGAPLPQSLFATMKTGDLNSHLGWVNRLIATNAIQRRN